MKSIFALIFAFISSPLYANWIVKCTGNDFGWSEVVEKKNPMISFGYDWVKIEKDNSVHVKIKDPKNKGNLLRERTCASGHWTLEKN